MQHRQKRIADAIKDAVAEIILEELSDPKIGFVTVTRANVSKDLKNATIYLSIMGDTKKQAEGLKRLDHARNFIRYHLARRVKLRYLPELRFARDEILDQEKRVGDILDHLNP